MTAAEGARSWRACTTAAKNYLGSVILLARSFTEHNPSIPFTALIVDAEPDELAGYFPFEVLTSADLPVPRETLERMQTYYDVTEFCTALKPALLQLLLTGASCPTVAQERPGSVG